MEVIPQDGVHEETTDKAATTFVLDTCFAWERIRSFSPSPEPVLVTGIAALYECPPHYYTHRNKVYQSG